jgi:hypothetical protein
MSAESPSSLNSKMSASAMCGEAFAALDPIAASMAAAAAFAVDESSAAVTAVTADIPNVFL